MSNQVDPMQQVILGVIAFVFFGLVAMFSLKIVRFFHSFWPIFSEGTIAMVAKIYRVAAIFFAGMGLAMAALGFIK